MTKIVSREKNIRGVPIRFHTETAHERVTFITVMGKNHLNDVKR